MHVEYKWHCEWCGATVWTKTSRMPEGKGCPNGNMAVYEGQERVLLHEWNGEEVNVRDRDDEC